MRELTKKEAIEAGCDEYTAKAYYIFQLEAGELVEIRKESISSTLWYDDETPDPAGKSLEHLKEVFVSYNMDKLCEPATAYLSDRPPYGFNRKLKTPYLIKKYRVDDYGPICAAELFSKYFYHEEQERERGRYGWSRDLDRSEVEELAECERIARERYAKRLETYWKRYQRKVGTRGYWANR